MTHVTELRIAVAAGSRPVRAPVGARRRIRDAMCSPLFEFEVHAFIRPIGTSFFTTVEAQRLYVTNRHFSSDSARPGPVESDQRRADALISMGWEGMTGPSPKAGKPFAGNGA